MDGKPDSAASEFIAKAEPSKPYGTTPKNEDCMQRTQTFCTYCQKRTRRQRFMPQCATISKTHYCPVCQRQKQTGNARCMKKR